MYVQNTLCWGLILERPTPEPVTSKRALLAFCGAPRRWKTCVEPGRFSLAASALSRLGLGCPRLFSAEDKPQLKVGLKVVTALSPPPQAVLRGIPRRTLAFNPVYDSPQASHSRALSCLYGKHLALW